MRTGSQAFHGLLAEATRRSEPPWSRTRAAKGSVKSWVCPPRQPSGGSAGEGVVHKIRRDLPLSFGHELQRGGIFQKRLGSAQPFAEVRIGFYRQAQARYTLKEAQRRL